VGKKKKTIKATTGSGGVLGSLVNIKRSVQSPWGITRVSGFAKKCESGGRTHEGTGRTDVRNPSGWDLIKGFLGGNLIEQCLFTGEMAMKSPKKGPSSEEEKLC